MKASNKTYCLTYENADTILRFLTKFTFSGSTLDNIQLLHNIWTFLLLAKLKTVILIFGNLDNTRFNIAWKDETEKYNFVLSQRKCKYDFSVYYA